MKKIKVWFAVDTYGDGYLFPENEKPKENGQGGYRVAYPSQELDAKLPIGRECFPCKGQKNSDEPKPYFLTLEEAEEGE